MKTPVIENANIGRATGWNIRANGFGKSMSPECTMLLSWRAFGSPDHEEWSATSRHKFVYVEQFQAFGITDHEPAFKHHAEVADVPVCVCQFMEPRYTLSYETCSTDVTYRYRECKLIRELSVYRSACCEVPLYCRERRE